MTRGADIAETLLHYAEVAAVNLKGCAELMADLSADDFKAALTDVASRPPTEGSQILATIAQSEGLKRFLTSPAHA
jgi:hypothetical protein